jgi:hypothetical protein
LRGGRLRQQGPIVIVQRQIARIARRAGGIGEDHDRRLQALGAVHRHHPHLPAGAIRIALQIAGPGIEPLQETGKARPVFGLIGKGGVDQLVERIIGLAPSRATSRARPCHGPVSSQAISACGVW